MQETGRRCGFDSWIGKIPQRRKRQPTPVFLPGKSGETEEAAGYSTWGRKELNMTKATEHTHTHTHTQSAQLQKNKETNTHTHTHTHHTLCLGAEEQRDQLAKVVLTLCLENIKALYLYMNIIFLCIVILCAQKSRKKNLMVDQIPAYSLKKQIYIKVVQQIFFEREKLEG